MTSTYSIAVIPDDKGHKICALTDGLCYSAYYTIDTEEYNNTKNFPYGFDALAPHNENKVLISMQTCVSNKSLHVIIVALTLDNEFITTNDAKYSIVGNEVTISTGNKCYVGTNDVLSTYIANYYKHVLLTGDGIFAVGHDAQVTKFVEAKTLSIIDKPVVNIVERAIKIFDYDGNEKWMLNNSLHRDEDLPALVTKTYSVWYKNGEKHRETRDVDGNVQPASIYTNGEKRWFHHDKPHSYDDKPAVIYTDGKQVWYTNGKISRLNDLPAIVNPDGDQKWFVDDKKHRDNDMPAHISANGDTIYYVNDNYHRVGNPAIIKVNGSKYWCLNSQYDRPDENGIHMPAVIEINGDVITKRAWYRDGCLHRDNDAPAVMTPTKWVWRVNGNFNRKLTIA